TLMLFYFTLSRLSPLLSSLFPYTTLFRSFCAANNSNEKQQEVSKFNYAKLSYELGYQDVALTELRRFLSEYPNSTYNTEARELRSEEHTSELQSPDHLVFRLQLETERILA